MTIENGGPPIDEDGTPKLRWAKINVAEILEGIEELSWEQRGYYLTALFKMYARMGGLPADDYEGAKAMRCDVRFFRRLRDQILATGKFYIEDGLLKNSRVEREIVDYIREFKKRREAALIREERVRGQRQRADELHSTSDELQGDFGETSGRSSGEVSDTSQTLGEENSTNSMGAVPQSYQKSTTNQNQEPEPRKEREDNPPAPQRGEPALDADAERKRKRAAASARKRAENERRRQEAEGLIVAYNAEAEKHGFGQCDTLTESRLSRLLKRLDDIGGAANFLKALSAVHRDDFLSGRIPGRDGKSFRLDLDRFLSTGSGLGDVLARLVETSNQATATPSRRWWQDDTKRESVTAEQWGGLITKHANGIWPVDKLGPPPGSPNCVVPKRVVDDLRLTEKYTVNGISREKH